MAIIGSKIIRKEKVESTSDLAKEIAESSSEGTVIIADWQKRGRGKPGSSWYSPKNVGLYFSLILKPHKNLAELVAFTLIAARAVITALADLYKLKAEVKLPNDVLVSGRKICGILVEKSRNNLIVGIGINVNTAEFPKDIAATSVYLELGKKAKTEKLFQEVLADLDKEYLKFLESRV